MDKVEAVRQGVMALGGEATAEQLAAFIKDRFSVKVEAKYIPIVRGMLKERELLAVFREKQAAERAAVAIAVTPSETAV